MVTVSHSHHALEYHIYIHLAFAASRTTWYQILLQLLGVVSPLLLLPKRLLMGCRLVLLPVILKVNMIVCREMQHLAEAPSLGAMSPRSCAADLVGVYGLGSPCATK